MRAAAPSQSRKDAVRGGKATTSATTGASSWENHGQYDIGAGATPAVASPLEMSPPPLKLVGAGVARRWSGPGGLAVGLSCTFRLSTERGRARGRERASSTSGAAGAEQVKAAYIAPSAGGRGR